MGIMFKDFLIKLFNGIKHYQGHVMVNGNRYLTEWVPGSTTIRLKDRFGGKVIITKIYGGIKINVRDEWFRVTSIDEIVKVSKQIEDYIVEESESIKISSDDVSSFSHMLNVAAKCDLTPIFEPVGINVREGTVPGTLVLKSVDGLKNAIAGVYSRIGTEPITFYVVIDKEDERTFKINVGKSLSEVLYSCNCFVTISPAMCLKAISRSRVHKL